MTISRIKELGARAALAWRILRGRDGVYEKHTQREFEELGYVDSDWMRDPLMEDVMDLIRVFSSQGHSGYSAALCLNAFNKAASFEPLSPLTGEDSEFYSEWHTACDITEVQQNIRCSRVFRDKAGNAFDVEGVIFETPDGLHCHSRASRVPITFPYTPRTVIARVSNDANHEEKVKAANIALNNLMETKQ